jgi:hypothetical protein
MSHRLPLAARLFACIGVAAICACLVGPIWGNRIISARLISAPFELACLLLYGATGLTIYSIARHSRRALAWAGLSASVALVLVFMAFRARQEFVHTIAGISGGSAGVSVNNPAFNGIYALHLHWGYAAGVLGAVSLFIAAIFGRHEVMDSGPKSIPETERPS